jgi:hypothetical protein
MRRWQIFEVIFGVPFLVAIALQLAVPLSLPRGSLTPAFILGGIAFIVVGLASPSLPGGSWRGEDSRPIQTSTNGS